MRRLKKLITKEILNKKDLLDMIDQYHKIPDLVFFDTETTGLNIAYDKPFVLPFGFIDYKTLTAYIYCVDIDKDQHLFIQTARTLISLAKNVGLVGHNIKYDIHMLNNVGVKTPDQIHYVDTQVYIRYAHDALTVENGGPPLGLKEYSVKYIERSAKDHEHIIKEERKNIATRYNRDLKARMYKVDKKWTTSYVEKYFKDVLNSVDTLDDSVKEIYKDWLKTIPYEIRRNMTVGVVESDNVPYNLLNREQLIQYAMYDIVYTMEVYLQCSEAVKARGNENAIEAEERVIPALVRMEACGFQMDKEYVKQVTVELADYLAHQRLKLYELIGEEVSVAQHAKIKSILSEKYNLKVPGTGKEDLNRIYDELKAKTPDAPVVQFIGLVQEIRTLEKWYAAYLLRFIREIEQGHDRIFTQINQVGTVSGRVTSDFQQFPKYGITKDDGSPLFHPRKMIITTPGYKGLAYLDYSQVELRLQALYTILVGDPDLNLCRAYMPYKCMHPTGYCGEWEEFDYTNPEHIQHAYDWDWYYKESANIKGYTDKWVATDVHAATTHVAFPDLDMKSDEFKKLRGKVGKRVNFA